MDVYAYECQPYIILEFDATFQFLHLVTRCERRQKHCKLTLIIEERG